MTAESQTPEPESAATEGIDPELLEILRCPESGASLTLVQNELWCRDSRRAYPIQKGLPVLLVEEARPLTDEELAASNADSM